MPDPATDTFEPTMLAAAWRYKWIVIVLAALAGTVGWLFARGTQEYTATASLAVQDPRSSIVFQQDRATSSDRYVADQAEIMSSRAVAAAAVEALRAAEMPISDDVDAFLVGLSVSSTSTTDLITITYTDVDGATSIAAANAIVDAYIAATKATADAAFGDAIAELETKIADLDSQVTTLTDRIDEIRAAAASETDLQAQLSAALDELLSFTPPPATATAAEIDLAAARLNELRARVNTLRAATGLPTDNGRLDELTLQRDEVRTRLAALQLRHDQLSVSAQLAGGGVVFTSYAETADPTSPAVLTVIGALGGLLGGAALARAIARRRRRFTGRNEPQLVLQTRLITDVPDFADERLPSLLPADDRITSAAAESFRFVATGVRLAQNATGSTEPDFRVVVVTSAVQDEGKTVVTANTAIAAARTGIRVAVVDADFRQQALTNLLAPDTAQRPGLTDVARGTISLVDAAVRVPIAQSRETLTLFHRGTATVPTQDFFSSTETKELIAEIAASNDLVLLDAPPLLRLAYSGTVVRLGHRLMAIVRHGSDVTLAEEMHRQLTSLGVPLLGYVYNRAPLRREMIVAYDAGRTEAADAAG